ncbi:acyltransferase family protein [Mycobacterium sp. ITM-2016-00318]|nr:acyltransferase family protein [Mycobacterium sp. ITM-2016-00318]WNG95700.1 acyltransferase family protein [Mycobacterium sp. ITM-2016-00318]
MEGLRAVAVIAVVLYHAGVPGVSGGFIGVDVFFVVSGFLITGLLWREASDSGTVRLARFYGARARRLLPAAVTVLVATCVASTVLLPPLQARSVLGDGIASALYVGNYRFAIHGTDYLAVDAPPSPLQHYWSLGVEEQFYLLWPALIIGTAWVLARAAQRIGARSVTPYVLVLGLLAAVSFALSMAWTENWPSWAFFSLPTRAWELAVGGLVALTAGAWRHLPGPSTALVGWGGLALILVTCTQIGEGTPYPGTAALLPVMGTALIIGAGCATPDVGVGRLLSKPAMRMIGRLSYSWYLWHWPVLLLAPAVIGHPLGLTGKSAMVVVSFGLAILTLHLIENPVRFAPSVKGSSLRSLAVGGVLTALAVAVCLVLLTVRPVPVGHGMAAAPVAPVAPVESADSSAKKAPPPMSVRDQVLAAVAKSADGGPVPSNLTPALNAIAKPEVFVNGCVLSWKDVAQPDCVSGDVGSPATVALVGDSHAAMWQPALEPVAREKHWRLATMSKVLCPFLDLPINSPYLGRKFTECERWRGDVMARLYRDKPQMIVLDMSRRYGADFGFTSYDQAWQNRLTLVVRTLRATGAEVLVLGPVADPHSTVPTCVSAHMDDAAACAPPRTDGLNDAGIAAEAAATAAGGGQYAKLSELFCTAERCPVVVGNTLVYRDDNHITTEYAKVLVPLLTEMVERALAS